MFASQGPALLNEPQVYGTTHFLRRLDPEAPGELRWRVLPLRDGSQVPPGGYADVDGFLLPSVLFYKTLVLPRSPIESRPPSVYTLAWSGVFYDVWQRPAVPLKMKSLAMLGITAASNRPEEFRVHMNGALNNGCSPDEIREIQLLVALYCGIPAAHEAHRIACETIKERTVAGK